MWWGIWICIAGQVQFMCRIMKRCDIYMAFERLNVSREHPQRASSVNSNCWRFFIGSSTNWMIIFVDKSNLYRHPRVVALQLSKIVLISHIHILSPRVFIGSLSDLIVFVSILTWTSLLTSEVCRNSVELRTFIIQNWTIEPCPFC